MLVDVKVPSMGESITSGVLGAWRKQNGEYVKEGDALFEIETDKVTSEVFAKTSGSLKRMTDEGSEVQVGQVVAQIDESAKTPAEQVAAPAPKEAKAAAAPEPAKKTAPAKSAENSDHLSPSVRRIATENQVDTQEVAGTGKGGRILKGDVISHLETPSAKPSKTAGPRTTRKKMTPLRKKIADRLVSAQHTAAILTTFNEVDMTNVMALRARFQDRFVAKHGIKLGFMSFFVKAVEHALKTVPAINAQIEGDEIVQNNFYDIGVAIGTEKGLMVPVLRDVDTLSFAGIEQAIGDYAKKAKAGKITLEDLQGGVFTISNGGTYGSLLSTPILNPPQSGILGMHTIQERPMAINGRVEIRPMMYLALSYDHRLVDGKEAVTFLVQIKEFIENPAIALLEL